jgi:hypothetical protein
MQMDDSSTEDEDSSQQSTTRGNMGPHETSANSAEIEAELMNLDEIFNEFVDGDTDDEIVQSSNERLLDFMQKHFNLTLSSGNQITTLNRTAIDLAFARNITVKCKSYISYYSHHCQMFNRIVSVANDIEIGVV